MTYQEYDGLPAVRWSNLKYMRRSPKHYKYALDHPRKDTPFFRLGRAVHTAVLEPDRLPLTTAVFTGKMRRGKEWEAFAEVNAGRTILKAEEYEMCLGIRDAVRAHPVAKHLLETGEAEKAVVWTDPLTGLRVKSRLDWLNSILCDLKTDARLHPRTFPMNAARYGYHCQVALYQAGLRVVTGENLPVKIMVVESEPPYDVGVFGVGEDALYAGDAEIRELLLRVAQCTERDEWPGQFGDSEVPLELPAWSFPADDSEGLGITIGGETL